MTYQGPAAPSWRARVGTVPLAVGVVVASLLVGVPVGVLTRPTAEAAPPSVVTTTVVDAPAAPAPVPAPAPPVADQLSAGEQTLSDALPRSGVGTCAPYPDGENIDGVSAAITCALEDPSMTQGIIFYQFTGSAAVASYLQARAAPITRPGACSQGYETSGPWNTESGSNRGTLVCVDNPKGGSVYFKMIWSDTATDRVAVIQEISPSTTWSWWYDNGGGQFRS